MEKKTGFTLGRFGGQKEATKSKSGSSSGTKGFPPGGGMPPPRPKDLGSSSPKPPPPRPKDLGSSSPKPPPPRPKDLGSSSPKPPPPRPAGLGAKPKPRPAGLGAKPKPRPAGLGSKPKPGPGKFKVGGTVNSRGNKGAVSGKKFSGTY